jgi:O-antigen/teichoic acid export membrane protein
MDNVILGNNKRIAQNTIFLYIRMFVLMGVNLYTSRVVLQVLGVEDFGIYSIVGSIVVFFSFFNSSLLETTNRFLSFELGKNDSVTLKKVFSISISVHFGLIILILLLSETIGLWFFRYSLNIPVNRMNAACWVYQFSIFTFCINTLKIPYNACIVSYEKMNFYAYFSILEAILKLGIVFILSCSRYDKLAFYSFLIFIVSVFIFLSYYLYCKLKFVDIRYSFVRDKKDYKKILNFSGWNLFTGIANVGSNIGINMLINIFYSVVVNAAIGIANQVSNAMFAFISNFQTAFNPQIVKLYASEQKGAFMSLIFRSSKFSYFLFLIICIPIIICTDYILKIWLGQVPEYAATFCRLILLYLLIDAMFAPLWLSIQATGKIRLHQIVTGILIFLNLPIAYILLIIGYPPTSVWIVRIVINLIAGAFRIIYLQKLINFSAKKYLFEVLFSSLIISFLSISIPYIFSLYWKDSLLSLAMTIIISILCSMTFMFTFGLNISEKTFIKSVIKTRFLNLFMNKK